MPTPFSRSGPYYIYGLREKGTTELRYIGATIRPEPRLSNHRHCRLGFANCGSEGYPHGSALSAWIARAEHRSGIEMVILEIWHTPAEARMAERQWIWTMLTRVGLRLLNGRRFDVCELDAYRERVA